MSTFRPAGDTPIEKLEPGIRRQMLGYGPELMLCRVWFECGAAGTPHSHPHSQSTYVESGRFRISIGGEARELMAGDACFVVSGQTHNAECIEAGVLIDAFSPMRADFLGEEV